MADEENSASIASDIAAAIESVEAPTAATPPEGAQTPPAATEGEGAATPPKTEGTGERQRGPDGKFLPKDDAAAGKPKQATEAAPKKAPEAAAVAAAATTQPAAPADPPAIARWSAADKETFRKLPKEGQDLLIRRHGEMEGLVTKATMESAEWRKTYEPVAQMFAPFKPQMQAQGWTEASLIKAWGDVERELMEGRGLGVIQRMVQQYKIDPAQVAAALSGRPAPVAGESAAPAAAPKLEPDVDAALNAIIEARFAGLSKPLADQLKALSTDFESRQRATAESSRQAALAQVQRFVEEKDAAGNLSHPYYPEVSGMMTQLARLERQQGRTPDLKAIYDQAVWATPSVREKLLAAQAAQEAQKRTTEARAEAARAARAGSSVQGAPVAGQPPAQARKSGPKSLREELSEAFDQSSDAA